MTSRFKFIAKYVRGVFRTVSLVVLASVLAFSILGLGIFYYLTSTLPDVAKLKSFQHSHATEVYSDEGRKIGEFTTERRYPVAFESIPKHVIESFLAAEDAKFYEHKGIDYNGILRAVFSNLTRGRYAQGGSTITQQVARALLLETKKKEITRKIREMVLAWRMERQLSKREILNLYLKEIYLGHGSFGIGAAARNYFNKKVESLDLAEASLLAGLPQRPNEWNPIRNPHLAKKRQAYVLKRMVDEGFIKPEAAKAAYDEPVRLHNLEDLNNTAAPYFTEYVRHYLMTKYGSEQILSLGYKIYTTVRYDFQKAAERSIDKGLREVDKRLGWRGVTGHMEDPTNQETFLRNTHIEVVEELNPARVLYPEAAQGTRGLEYDLTPYLKKDSAYFGATPVKEGESYRALVFDVENEKAQATAKIGQTSVLIPFATMSWVKIEGESPKTISEVLKSGDMILVKIEKIEKRAGVVTASLDQEPEVQGALLSYEAENGFVRAMVGGHNFNKSKFNCALQAKRQVGSTFKPLMYAAAFDKGYSPASLVTDAPIVFKTEGKSESQTLGPTEEEWKPHNYGNKFEGDIPLRTALVRSMNVPTVKLLNEIGVDYGIQYARTLGITSALPRDLTIGLGSWSSSLEEMMRAYAIFPRLGKPVVLHYIKKVEDSEGNIIEEFSEKDAAVVAAGEASKGEPKESSVPRPSGSPAVSPVTSPDAASNTPPKLPPGHVISPQTAYVMTDMLKSVIRDPFGTAHSAGAVKGNVAGKTGTTNDHRDAWFIGYSPAMIAGVWIGYLKDKALDPGETGGKAAAPIWADYMKFVADSYPNVDFPIPEDIVFGYMDRNTGKLAGPGSANRVRVAFKAGTVPNQFGDNILRVGEPGVRATGSTVSAPAEPGTNPIDAPLRPNEDQETSDFIRQEYQ